MINAAPIELNFYDEEDNVIDTYKRARIPSYLLDMAINLQEGFSEDSVDQKYSDALFDFIVEFYGSKFTRDDLKKKTDLIECMAVLQSVIARASNLMRGAAQSHPNLQRPSRKKK